MASVTISFEGAEAPVCEVLVMDDGQKFINVRVTPDVTLAVPGFDKAGARWAVVGTRATRDAQFLRDICRLHPDRIVVAVDARGQRVAVEGWTAVVEDTVMQVGARARDAGAVALLFTDVSRDGTELGPNVEDTAALAREVGMPVLASGGVGRVEDLKRLAAIPGVVGTVVGRALYTGAIDLHDAQSALAASD